MNAVIKTISAVTATALFFGLSAQTLGDEARSGAQSSKAINASDLDMEKPEDVQTLYERIRTAARIVCRTETSNLWDVKRVLHKQQCFEATVDNVVNGVAQPELTAVHRGEIERVAGL